MKKRLLFITAMFMMVFANAQTPVFINEIHYDDFGGDTLEGVEIAGPAGTDLSNYQIVLYNGNDNLQYGVVPLSGVISAIECGIGAIWFPIAGIQNGAPDGIALATSGGTLIQFLSYEGVMTAGNDVANGVTSTDIGVAEPGDDGNSLQLIGTGTTYEDFTWAPDTVNTYNAVNIQQSFCTSIPTTPVVKFASVTSSKMENDATNDTIWVNLSKVATQTDTVYISANNGTATYTSDFTTTPDLSSNTMFEINAGDSTIMIIVNMVDDAVYEGNENFTLTITSVTDSLTIGSPSTLTYTILENETPPASAFTSIIDIQTPGAGSDSSLYKGDTVFIAGIVTAAKATKGYWVQKSTGGEYSGIYVFDATNTPSEGDSVTVKGTVDEFFGSTQLESVTEFNNISSGNSYVTTALTADLAGSESYESVMVSISSALVTDIALGFGEFMVDDNNDTIRIDDFIYNYNMPSVNDTLDITGVVAFSFDNWKIYPRDSNDISGASPPVVGDASNNCVGNTVLETYNWKDFEDLNLTSGGWSNEVVTGTTDWRTGSFMGDNYARISNFSGGANSAAETWLISPSMNLTNSTSPQVSFLSLSKFDGAPLKLMASINYTSGDPNAAAWVDLSSQALWDTDLVDWGDWVCSGNVPLSNYKQSNVHIAFKYTGSGSDGTSWELDDIAVFNGDGVFIEEEVSNSFEIYPNPASDKLNIILTQNNNAKINIIDLSGKTVVSQNTKGMTNVISIDNLNSGLYFIEVKTENTVERVKFIKK